jgi:hypothetical protein
MAKDIFGNYVQTSNEIADELIRQNSTLFCVSPKIGTKQGYYLMEDATQITGVHKSGFYAFFVDTECVYVGSSMNEEKGITNRISRFVKGIQGNYTNKNREWHSGAEKYRFTYGSNFSKLKLMIMKYPKIHKKQAEEIERELIRKLKPKFNKK